MGATIDSIWVLALFSKCTHLISLSILLSSFILLVLVWLAMAMLHWAHPGGPAWGKHRLTRLSKWPKKPIPGPKGYPILGSMSLMTGLAHRKIATAAARCGASRLMAFSIGETRAIVTCHAEVAREILHSPNFADRPVKESAYSLMFNRAIGFAPYGSYWRALRRVAANHMFSPKQIKASEGQRASLASDMARVFQARATAESGPFGVRDVLRRASLGNMMGSVFGLRLGLDEKPESERVAELEEMVREGYDLLGALNWADHLSFLADFDLQKIRSRCDQLVPRVNRFVSRIIAEHRSNPVQQPRDFVDVLLSLQGSEKLSDSDMIAVLWVSITYFSYAK